MNTRRQPSMGRLTTTLLASIFFSQTGLGGAITSANYPLPPPPPIIPGVMKLTCTLNISSNFGVWTRPKLEYSEKMNTAETHLDYEKAEGDDYFKCVDGCENPTWKRFRLEWPTGEVKPIPKVTLIGQIGLPSLSLKIYHSKLFLQTNVTSAHRSWTGSVVSNENQTLVPLEGKEFYAEARTNENVEGGQFQEFKKLVRGLNRDLASSASSQVVLRCTVLKPGQISETQIEKILAIPPRAGTISARKYIDATSIRDISQPYVNVLKLARNLDSDHRKALIAKFVILYGGTEFLKPVAAKVRQTIEAHPEMTAENAWGFIDNFLGIHPMSPSGIVIPPVVPLILAEEDAVVQK